jgi:ClpP class serine protease
MGLLDIVWLFFLVAAVQPIIRQRLLEASRQRLLTQIQRERGSRIILLVHRQETMSVLGFPLLRYIDINDSEAIIHAIRNTDPEVPLDLVLHTPGGLVLPSYQIARAINRRRGKVTVFVPHYAMSGGTLIALAADEIVMSDHAVLGPVDPQVGEYPAASLLRVVATKPIEHVDDETLILADQAEKAIHQLTTIVREMLIDDYDEDEADRLARLLTEGTWTHDYAITAEEAHRLGLKVSTEIPEAFLELMSLYPQPLRRNPSVEHGPRRSRPPRPPASPA